MLFKRFILLYSICCCFCISKYHVMIQQTPCEVLEFHLQPPGICQHPCSVTWGTVWLWQNDSPQVYITTYYMTGIYYYILYGRYILLHIIWQVYITIIYYMTGVYYYILYGRYILLHIIWQVYITIYYMAGIYYYILYDRYILLYIIWQVYITIYYIAGVYYYINNNHLKHTVLLYTAMYYYIIILLFAVYGMALQV